jgi:5-aminopentanamidase
MPPIVKIAAVQMNPKLMRNGKNLEQIIMKTREAAADGAMLIVFPECALTGYMFASQEEALPYAEAIPGPATEKVGALCKELGVYVIFGLLEQDGNKLYNAAAFLGPDGLIGKYRKNHLPYLGVDRFIDKGDNRITVFNSPVGNVGILICYDMTFPENARVMMLNGADIIVVITNWPRQREMVAKHMVNTRALENHVYLVASDRVGTERKGKFLGRSKIADTAGQTLGSASTTKEEIIYADADLELARQKHLAFVPGEFETDFIRDRRPELYGDIVKPVKAITKKGG